ncbi:MAG TPA: fused response regulator/phosphatase [Kiritimatiellia bacterium]|nr:fused response regulator/phosphatase [Kiritimatiellia bacterium]HMO99067.1 fused response regulator/phosphatase [Kiritimatiellia bacterium]HMP97132.1 fused response regulator/phosphatase [Kiritimatiellia bacterium]
MTEFVKVLLVDDRPENLIALEHLLEMPGLKLIKAGSGNEALQQLIEHDIALVLLDVQMPGMDGYETAELMRLNPKTRRIPIIFVTATSGERQHIFKGYETGAVDYITKPIEPLVLTAKVEVFCQLWRQRRELEESQKALAAINQVLEGKNRQLEEELDLARKVQVGFLPTEFPREGRIRFGHTYEFCTTLGGDLFDVFSIDADHVGFYLADVSGHGVNAALISGLLKMAFENMKNKTEVAKVGAAAIKNPAQVLTRLNEAIRGMIPEEYFITLIYAVIRLSDQNVSMSSAGHPYPILFDAASGKASWCSLPNGPALSMTADPVYENHEQALKTKDKLLFYTDGFTEAFNMRNEEFGEERFRQVVEEHGDQELDVMLKSILEAVNRHREAAAISDDCTMVAVQLV